MLPAAGSFNDRGFHEALTATHELPPDLRLPPGARLVLSLRDVGRPSQQCGREHPLSGCATVDWSDATGRPHVPASGVFDSHVTLALAGGSRLFFLSESGALADAPDAFSPG